VKVLDNAISAAKSIALYQNKPILSAIFATISQFLFFYVVSGVLSDGSTIAICVVSLSAGFGNYLASFINDKISKDRTFINIITCSDMDAMDKLSKYLYEHKIKCILYDTYTRCGEKSYSIQAFAKTRAESIKINEYIRVNNIKCLREIVE
jgi:hypothetical protein